MRQGKFSGLACGLASGLVLLASGSAGGQQIRTNIGVETPETLPAWLAIDLSGTSRDAARRHQATQPNRREIERELRRLRFTYFRASNQVELRQIGISQLRQYDDPELYPLILEIFRGDDLEVRTAILDMLLERRTSDADVTMAWAAIHDRDSRFRQEAMRRLRVRIDEEGRVPDSVVYLVAGTLLQQRSEEILSHAAHVAANLNIVQVIPHLINAQLGGRPTGGSGRRQGDLGWILIGRQVAFVSDLTPVVADSAVGFDPQLSVITEGVLLRVGDAAVVTYRYDVHNALLGLAGGLTGRSLAHLGWDQPRWWDWYRSEGHSAIERATAQAEPDEGDPDPEDAEPPSKAGP